MDFYNIITLFITFFPWIYKGKKKKQQTLSDM